MIIRLGVKDQDLVVHRGEAGLALLHQLRLEAALAITVRVQLEMAIFCLQGIASVAVATVGVVTCLIEVVAEVVVKLGIQCCLDSGLGSILLNSLRPFSLLRVLAASNAVSPYRYYYVFRAD